MPKLVRFMKAEDGAGTVDWVVITAAIVTLSLVTVVTVKEAAIDPADGIGAKLSAINP